MPSFGNDTGGEKSRFISLSQTSSEPPVRCGYEKGKYHPRMCPSGGFQYKEGSINAIVQSPGETTPGVLPGSLVTSVHKRYIKTKAGAERSSPLPPIFLVIYFMRRDYENLEKKNRMLKRKHDTSLEMCYESKHKGRRRAV